MTLQAALWEIICGSIAGALGKLIDYPFDTIKVRMQTQGINVFPTTWSCIQYTYDNEGILDGFYQGILSPLLGAAFENAILFVSYNQCYNLMSRYTEWDVIWIILISGAFAGSCASFVLTPVELIKCKLQVSNLHMQMYREIDIEGQQPTETEEEDDEIDTEEMDEDVKLSRTRRPSKTRNAPVERSAHQTAIIPTINSIIEEKGVWGLWQGQMGTFIRESIGSLIWFGTFQLLKRYFVHKNTGSWDILDNPSNESNETGPIIHSWQLLISGAIAGFIFNGSVFPVDTIKSLMQTEHLGFREAINHIHSHHGIAGFYRGLAITLFRSIPSNAAIFYTYEKLTN
ncbi:mitochondrial ornithine transporter 1 [Monosporozyma servazzii]